MKYGEHESVYFRDTIAYSIGELGIHRLGYFLAINAGVWSAICMIIAGPFWTHGWPYWWNWWLSIPIWRTLSGLRLRWRASTPSTTRSWCKIRRSPGSRCRRRLSARRQGDPLCCSGRIGEMQLLPTSLDAAGMASLVCGFIAIEIIGLNMWASVDWNFLRFIKMLPFLSLEPPPPSYGLSLPPLERGRLVADGGLLPHRGDPAVVGEDVPRARAIGMGTHVCWCFASAIWLYLVLGFIRPLMMGCWCEAVPFGVISHLNWTATFSVRYGNLFYDPFHMLSIVFLYGSVCCSPCTPAPSSAVAKFGGERETHEIVDRARRAERGALFWRWTMGFNATFESIHRWIFWFATLTTLCGGIGILLSGTVVDNWYLWGVKHGIAPEYPWSGHPGVAAAPGAGHHAAGVAAAAPAADHPHRETSRHEPALAEPVIGGRPRRARLGLLVPQWRLPGGGTQLGLRAQSMMQFTPTAAEAAEQKLAPLVLTAVPTSRAGDAAFKNVSVLTDVNAGDFMRLQHAMTAWVSPKQGCGFCHDAGTTTLRTPIPTRRRRADAGHGAPHQRRLVEPRRRGRRHLLDLPSRSARALRDLVPEPAAAATPDDRPSRGLAGAGPHRPRLLPLRGLRGVPRAGHARPRQSYTALPSGEAPRRWWSSASTRR